MRVNRDGNEVGWGGGGEAYFISHPIKNFTYILHLILQ